MASHFDVEMHALFEILVVFFFLAPKGGPVGIFKDFKVQFFCLGPLKLHFK